MKRTEKNIDTSVGAKILSAFLDAERKFVAGNLSLLEYHESKAAWFRWAAESKNPFIMGMTEQSSVAADREKELEQDRCNQIEGYCYEFLRGVGYTEKQIDSTRNLSIQPENDEVLGGALSCVLAARDGNFLATWNALYLAVILLEKRRGQTTKPVTENERRAISSAKKSLETLAKFREKQDAVAQIISQFCADKATELWLQDTENKIRITRMCELLRDNYLPDYLHALRKESIAFDKRHWRGPLGVEKKIAAGKAQFAKGRFAKETLSADTIKKYLKKHHESSPFIPIYATRGGGRESS